jgi:hypothetical protein
MPPLAALLPFLGKAVGFAKGLVGISGAAKTAAGVAGMAKGAAARAAMPRMAGQMLTSIPNRFATSGAMPKNLTEAAMTFGPDVFFGGMAAVNTPGDVGDKLIAGGMSAAGGALGGVGLRGAIGSQNMGINVMSEMIGGIGGDMLGQSTADSMMRLKGGGTTPYEKMAAEQQKQLEQDILRKYLSGKGGYPNELV